MVTVRLEATDVVLSFAVSPTGNCLPVWDESKAVLDLTHMLVAKLNEPVAYDPFDL